MLEFSRRVKGAEAVNDNEFITEGQMDSDISTFYKLTGTDELNRKVGDTAWDSDYFFVKTVKVGNKLH